MKQIAMLVAVSLLVFLSASGLVMIERVSAIDNDENTWVGAAPLPAVKSGESGEAAVVAGKIYVMSSSTNFEFDPATNAWTAKTPMPTPRLYFAIASYQNKIYIIGGYNRVNGTNTEYSVNEVYDPATDTWQTKQPMPTSRYDLTANVVNGEIYLISGSTNAFSLTVENDVYNVANDSWTTKEPIPYAVGGYASAVMDGKVFIMGGSNWGSAVNFNQIYDPANDNWSMGARLPNPICYAAAGATIGIFAPKRIYVFGGQSSDEFGSTSIGMGMGTHLNQVYNPENDTWILGASMPIARELLTIGVVNDKLYVMGGVVGLLLDTLTSSEIYSPIGYGTPDPSYLFETSPPTLTLVSPNQIYNVSSVPLVFTSDKQLDWAGYSLDGKQNVTINGNFTLTDLSNGSHTIRVYANDTFGNVGASQTVAFSVVLPPSPRLFLTEAVVAVVGAAGVVIGVFLYLRKKKPATVSLKES